MLRRGGGLYQFHKKNLAKTLDKHTRMIGCGFNPWGMSVSGSNMSGFSGSGAQRRNLTLEPASTGGKKPLRFSIGRK